MCPVAQQPKRSQPAGVGDAPRHDRDIVSEVGGDLGGEQRAGSFSRLDDHDDAGERGDDPLGGKEAPAPGRGEPGRELRDRGTMQKDAVVQVVELAALPFVARSLSFDGTRFWTHDRDARKIVAFARPD